MSALGNQAGKHIVSLINPPSAPGTLANREGAAGMGVVYPDSTAFFYPPHTLATVAAHLRDAGHVVQALDGLVQQPGSDAAGNALSRLSRQATGADAVAVFVSYASLETDIAFIADLRRQTEAKLIAFGSAMRFVGEKVLESAPVDAVLIGEAEGFFAAALQHLLVPSSAAGRPDAGSLRPQALTPSSVGASCCDAAGFVDDLDTLPFPAWDLLPYEQYKLLTVFGSRGCPDGCAYCPYAAAQGHRFRARSVESVLAELAWLSQRFRPTRVVFRDPVFAYDRDRVIALCEGILKQGLRLRWECESRPEHFDAELLRLMQRAGCQWIKIGLETTDEPLLQKLCRVASANEAAAYLERVAQVVQACTTLGLQCRLFVMAGLPGQDVAMTERTRDFVGRLRPTALNIKAFEEYPGLHLATMPAGEAASRSAPTRGYTTAQDVGAQMAILQQAQLAVNQRSSPGLLVRGKRWLSLHLRQWLRGMWHA